MRNLISKLKKFLKNDKEIPFNWHEDFIVNLAENLRPNTYCELWLYRCELFNRIVPFSNRLIWVDLSKEPGKFMKKCKKTEFHNMTTDDYFENIKGSWIQIDLLFIDANHSKESVMKDFVNYFELVSNQGIILLHDWYPKNEFYTQSGYCWDWYLAIAELSKKCDTYEMVTIPVHPGLTICRKRTEHLVFNK